MLLASQGIHVEQMMMDPYQLSPDFFTQRMREVSPEQSAAVFEDLRETGILKQDNCSHFIAYDDWWVCLHQIKWGICVGIS